MISIHAPREGSDRACGYPLRCSIISIHAPREGSDAVSMVSVCPFGIFLSTLPVRGATVEPQSFLDYYASFLSTLPVRGATFDKAPCYNAIIISIHAPREGSDGCCRVGFYILRDFYPRSP